MKLKKCDDCGKLKETFKIRGLDKRVCRDCKRELKKVAKPFIKKNMTDPKLVQEKILEQQNKELMEQDD